MKNLNPLALLFSVVVLIIFVALANLSLATSIIVAVVYSILIGLYAMLQGLLKKTRNRLAFLQDKGGWGRRCIDSEDGWFIVDHDGSVVVRSGENGKAVFVKEPQPREYFDVDRGCVYWCEQMEIVRKGRASWSCPLCGEDVSLAVVLMIDVTDGVAGEEFKFVKPLERL